MKRPLLLTDSIIGGECGHQTSGCVRHKSQSSSERRRGHKENVTLLAVTLAGATKLLVIITSLLCLLAESAPNGPGANKPAPIRATTTPTTGGHHHNNRQQQQQQHYYGSLIGKLNGREHNVSGNVFAVDEQTIFIEAFSYDGLAADAYFWSSTSSAQPSADGFIVPDEKGSTKPLERYTGKDVVLRLPEGKTLREINWLSIWSRPQKRSAADIHISRQLVIPRPLEINPFSQLKHELKSGPITIVDAQTFLVPDFHYDGLGPEAYFWLTRGGQGLGASGLRLKDENGSSNPLRKYTGETVVISLPDELTIYDFDYFGVWCKKFQVNFGQTRIPQSAKVPPSPKMLGIKPENKLNCEILYDDLGYEIRWVLDGDDIVMQLVGKIEPNEYMAFGLGKDDSKSDMSNADAVVTWVDRVSGQVHAVDYFLGGKAQCVNDPHGSCPDTKLVGGGDSLTLLHGAIVNGYSMVTFKRPQLGVDEVYDQHVYSDGQQSVIWAIGVLNGQKEIGYHRLRTKGNMFIDFARNPQWNCPIPDLNASMHNNLPVPSASQVDPTVVSATVASADPDSSTDLPEIAADSRQQPSQAPTTTMRLPTMKETSGNQEAAWFIPSIVCPSERILYAQIGPTGGRRGYEGVTGRPSWGVSWYINGLLIPELVLERGQTYRFVVEGGNDKTSTSRRHPFYLTDSPEGGFDYKTDEERQRERIFAGVALRGDGQFVPTAEGRLCEWRPTNATLSNPDLYQTFSAYQRSLKLECRAGQASQLKFAPDANTPDLIYYQCYTNRFMGWRIRVVDSCSAYMNSLRSSSGGTSGGGGGGSNNNNIKRDTTNKRPRDELAASSELKPTYDRRQSTVESTTSFLPTELRSNHFHAASNQLFAGEFGDDPSSTNTFTTELNSIPNDMLIMNASQLMSKQPVNFSMLEQILKLSPSDLEIMEDSLNQQQQLQHQLQHQNFLATNGNFLQQELMIGRNPLVNSTNPDPGAGSSQQKQQNKVTASAKIPKTLQAYMRRLASIYYPVQQQLASMLSGPPPQQSTTTAATPTTNVLNPFNEASASQVIAGQLMDQNPVAQPSEQAAVTSTTNSGPSSAFSLSSLVPKSKIDLSKSNISKKLNKFRIKSGRKYEPVNPHVKQQPPTPANEFNYDIFNNQLAQLEKQQKQFQTLELANWPNVQQPSSESLNYLPLSASSSDEQQVFEDLQSVQMLNNMLKNTNNQFQQQHHHHHLGPLADHQPVRQHQSTLFANTYSPPPPRPDFVNQQPMRISTIPLGTTTPMGQQPYVSDYLSMAFNRTGGGELPAGAKSHHNQWMQSQQPARNQHQSQSQHAVFITRLPTSQAQGYPLYVRQQHPQAGQATQRPHWTGNMNQLEQQQMAGYQQQHQQPLVSNEEGPRQVANYMETSGQLMSSMPSMSLSIHESKESVYPPGLQLSGLDAESLSGSGSGSYYDFRQIPAANAEQQQSGEGKEFMQSNSSLLNSVQSSDLDHMMAIERFSKQSSERRPPSVVHPITGEQVQLMATSFDDQRQHYVSNSSQHKSPHGQPNAFMDDTATGPSSNDILEADQTIHVTSELRRLNATPPSSTSAKVSPPSDHQSANQIQRTGQFGGPSGTVATTSEAPAVSMALAPPTSISPGASLENMILTSTVGPLVPSVGPPTYKASTNNNNNDDELVLRSTLIEPITSTLVQTPSLGPLGLQPQGGVTSQPLVSGVNYDSSPFIPIELSDPTMYLMNQQHHQQQQQQFAASQMITGRPRQPPLIESMLHQHQNPFRPEPPVQVAAYLAHQLASHNPMLVSSERSIASSKPVAMSVAIPKSPVASDQSQNATVASSSSQIVRSVAATNDLIILKPAILTKLTPQTYALKPEYMTNKMKSANGNENAPVSENDLYYPNDVEPARRLAGHQFERLSSLSSPPSTSMALDPMQVAHTVTSYVKQSNADASKASRQLDTSSPSNKTLAAEEPAVKTNNNDISSSKVMAGERLNQHRQTVVPSKQVPLALEGLGAGLTPGASLDGVRLNPGGDNVNTLPRDNATDNAILSHVMSLISSNAIPVSPLVPISTYSSADYFIPISDRLHSRSIRG